MTDPRDEIILRLELRVVTLEAALRPFALAVERANTSRRFVRCETVTVFSVDPRFYVDDDQIRDAAKATKESE